jgi:hypothetical protein
MPVTHTHSREAQTIGAGDGADSGGPHVQRCSAAQAWAERQANVKRFTDLESGHFAALEVPETYANDVRESAKELWK